MMAEPGFLGWLLIGLIAGGLGKLIMPGKDPGGVIVTIIVGIVGALLAGFLARTAGIAIRGQIATYLAATVGAIALLALYRLIITRRTR
ncbi:GlsB/YeaQ/YmgE family stress response membrane protein [Sphingomonas sp. SFZ2018-12]|uniref:GlsB/YeaQ/YmgE family stress response membrane protein n=1 Tax=Sphingomonas sp. SFZ2018-12 TaxID=2683197 RepID=UPI001F10BE60|nr:GlsB/YeaQ/YmgE family stress response membrane protein [Sphingomonas sp. SFZ2018-12]MCH4893878.1 GlsB/YeaQ/YmgE family stress response membrane protein [Sphingomonas sp. SFZ2018-12]